MVFCRSSPFATPILILCKTAKRQYVSSANTTFSVNHWNVFRILMGWKQNPLPSPSLLPVKEVFTEHFMRGKFCCGPVYFVPAMWVTFFFFFASTSSKLIHWSTHLKAELMYCCTLRKKGIFQDKAGHCSHFYSLIALRLLPSNLLL